MKTLICLAAALVVSASLPVFGQVLSDTGFEATPVVSGGFVKPTSGAWLFGNDAGVTAPFAPNSSTGPLNTWSATFAAFEGQQYASTYAGGDTIRQAVLFSSPGTYQLSVYAAAPSGTVTIPTVGTFTLGDGEFTLTLNNVAIGNLQTVLAGSSWSLYNAQFTVAAPGTYDLGIRNTKTSPYFINYDAFSLQAVPEPTASQILLLIGLIAGSIRRAK